MLFDDVLGQLGRLKAALQNPGTPVKPVGPLLNQIGMLGVESSQQAFRDQAFGGIKWPARYPGQGDPKFNVAGALQDFKAGRTAPKPIRFQDRPAGVDEGLRGGVWGSLSWRVDGKTVVWGSQKPHAARVNLGGPSVITYDKATKKRIGDWLYQPSSPRPQRRKTTKERFSQAKVKSLKGNRTREEYAKYLRPLLRPDRNVLKTEVIARPFVGVTDTLSKDINRAIVDYYTGAQL